MSHGVCLQSQHTAFYARGGSLVYIVTPCLKNNKPKIWLACLGGVCLQSQHKGVKHQMISVTKFQASQDYIVRACLKKNSKAGLPGTSFHIPCVSLHSPSSVWDCSVLILSFCVCANNRLRSMTLLLGQSVLFILCMRNVWQLVASVGVRIYVCNHTLPLCCVQQFSRTRVSEWRKWIILLGSLLISGHCFPVLMPSYHSSWLIVPL